MSDAPSRARRIIKKNDTILSTVRTYLKAIAFVDEKNDGRICSTGFAVISPKNNLEPKFLNYLLSSEGYIDHVMANSVGVTYPAINSSDLGRFPCIKPPLKEAEKISKFLSDETTHLDNLISKSQSQINFLQEKRQALITHAVTKGLDPTVPMKDSGVEWIGEIPEHWEKDKLGRRMFFQEGPGLRNWQFTDSGTRVICVTNITTHGIDFSKHQRFIDTKEYLEKYKHFTVQDEDFLLASSGNSWGKVSVYSGPNDLILNTSTIRVNTIDPNKFFRDLIGFVLESNCVQIQLKMLITGAAQPNFGPTHLQQIIIPVAPIEEQKQIYDFLQKGTTHLDNLISKSQSQINFLQEKRQALITATVTGKIDVRNGVA